MMRIPIGLGQPAVEAIELIASGDKVVMSVKAPGVPGGYEVLALGAMPTGLPPVPPVIARLNVLETSSGHDRIDARSAMPGRPQRSVAKMADGVLPSI